MFSSAYAKYSCYFTLDANCACKVQGDKPLVTEHYVVVIIVSEIGYMEMSVVVTYFIWQFICCYYLIAVYSM
jgi:hypothetical protein